MHAIRLHYSGTCIDAQCSETTSLLTAFERQTPTIGLSGCRGGGCGICKIRITEGKISLGPMSRRHVSKAEIGEGYVLACRAFPRTDVVAEHAGMPAAPQTISQTLATPGGRCSE